VKTHVIDHTVFVVQSCKAYAEFSFPCAVEQTKEETRVWIPLACFIAIPLCSAVKFAQLCATGPVPEAVHKGLFFSLLFFLVKRYSDCDFAFVRTGEDAPPGSSLYI
jgi:hypothetical protein